MTLVVRSTRQAVALLTLDHPPVNSLGHETRSALHRELTTALRDPSISAVLLLGAGKLFSAGADIREFGTAAMVQSPNLRDLAAQLDDARKPVIVAYHGSAAGGAIELGLACHYRLASRTARMALPEVTLGLVPGAGGTQRLPRLIGAEAALKMITSGAFVTADAAYASGLVDGIIDCDLQTGALDFINRQDLDVRRTRDMPTERESTEVRSQLFADARLAARSQRPEIAARLSCIECVETVFTAAFDDGLQREGEIFAACLASEESSGLRHAFFAERAVHRIPGLEPDVVPRVVEQAGVVGCGTMGRGIAISLANAGIAVRILETSAGQAAAGLDAIQTRYDSRVARGRMTQDTADQRLGRISVVSSYDDLADVDLVIEAVFEEMEIKQDVFRQLDAACRPGAILATNTSTLNIDAIASVTGRPRDVVGTHFFSPADVMKLMENVRAQHTAPDVIATVMHLSRRLSKVGVLVGVCDGFVGNRMLFPYLREAEFLLEEGATPEQVDRVMTDFGFAMGPFAVSDLAGLDVGWRIRQRQAPQRNPEDRYSVLADRVCEAGRFGQKTGAGWYRYRPGDRTPRPDPWIADLLHETAEQSGRTRRAVRDDEILHRCVYPLINEGARVLEEGIALRPGDIDVIWLHGYGFPRHRGGPMFYADRIGTAEVLRVMRDLHAKHGELMRPARLLESVGSADGAFGPG